MIPNKHIKRHKLVEPKWETINNNYLNNLEAFRQIYLNSAYGTTNSNRFITCDIVVSGSTSYNL